MPRTRLAALVAVAVVTASVLVAAPAQAATQTFYVSASGGSDANSGLSAAAPWKTLAAVSAHTFSAGDSVLLKKGDTWTGESLTLNGSGTSTNWITLSSYGSGARPAITPYTSVAAIPAANATNLSANGLLYGIYLHNTAGWKITGLEIGFAKSGIVYANDAAGTRDGLWIEDCDIHDITKWPMDPFPSADNRVAPLKIMSYSVGVFTHLDESSPSNERLRNVTVKDVTFERTDAPLEIRHSDQVDIDAVTSVDSYREGIQLTGINNGSGSPTGALTNSVVRRAGLSGMAWGTAGLQFNGVSRFVADNVEIDSTKSPNGIDGVGVDFEGLDNHVTLQNSYVHDNDDEAVMVYRNPQWSGGVDNVDTSMIGNVFANNGIGAAGAPHAAFLVQQYNIGNGGTISGNTIIKKDRAQALNMIIERTPQQNEFWPADSDYAISGNTVKLSNGNVIDYASTGFSSTQGANNWSYRQFDGSTISNLTWNAVDRTWDGTATFLLVGEDWMHPAGGYKTERVWTAPMAGRVRITGTPRKTDNNLGNGVVTSIWKNGTQIWASVVTDTTGVSHDLQATVAAGDTIGFVLDSNGDASNDKTTWNPVVEQIRQTSYTAAADFAPQQSMYGWTYLENNGTSQPAMTWDGTNGVWAGSASNLYIGADWQHPAIGIDAQRTWLAPSAGTVTISGTVRKYDSTAGNGVIASIWKNGTRIWGDTTVTSLTGSTHSVTTSVAAGDAISFRVGSNGDPSNDKTYWNPTISY